MDHIEQTIEQLSGEIALRQNIITSLSQLRGSQPVAIKSEPVSEPKAKRHPHKKSPPCARTERKDAPVASRSVTADLDKPDTVGGAMKQVIRGINGSFTYETIETALNADADWRKLLAGASAGTLGSNLTYWSKTGKLAMDGDMPRKATFTVTLPEFFN